MGKLESSAYLPGKRSKSWTKVKCVREREFVVGGWREGEGGRSGQIGSLALGYVEPRAPAPGDHPFALRYAGLAGSGLDDLLLRHLAAAFRDTTTDTSPFVDTPPSPPLHFVQPTIVVEVMFSEMTTAGVLRQPSIKGIRNDVDPAEVVWTEELA
jgi:ATP-dependent DNA ligase